MSTEIIGMDATFAAIDKHFVDLTNACQEIVEETTINTDADIKKSITDQGIVDTGRYRAGWQVKIGHLEGSNSNNVEYGPEQEFGTSKMRARPHVIPSFEKNRRKFIEACRKL